MAADKKGERTAWRLAYALAILVPLLSIVIAQAAGWNVMAVYLAAEGVEYACIVFLAILMVIFGLLSLWSYIRLRFF